MTDNNLWTILSFDIGIKTLAYCLLSFDPEAPAGNQYLIQDWNVINLFPETKNPVCQGSLRTRKGDDAKCCNKKASFVQLEKNYCGTHVDKGQKYDKIRIPKVKDLTNQDINLALVHVLDKIPGLMNCDEVLFEHQPNTNSPTKKLLFMLHSYFTIRSLVDRTGGDRLKNIHIRQINSKKKFSIYDGPKVECHLKRKYDQNKFYSETYCCHLIRNDAKWSNFFNMAKKKDDLADSFLQGAWHANCHTDAPRVSAPEV